MPAPNALALTAAPRYFDQPAWRRLCTAACDTAARACGASDTVFTSLYSAAIDAALRDVPAAQQPLALAIARELGDYATAEEIARDRAEMLAQGWCTHGIDPNACPAGCGDLAAERDGAANEDVEQPAEEQKGADPHDLVLCWSFLQSKQWALEARGFAADLARRPAVEAGSGARLVFTWVPGECSPLTSRASREYALEISLPAGAGDVVARFAGCGLDCARTERRAGADADLDAILTQWFTEFQHATRMAHDVWFVHATGRA
ncbi:hypothetical protein [Methylibium petroleiphilum]|uniref:Uncharacterized protein n=1 Tax=Methylibium petroleiphilum (strain ATCC BAA-1232 / LMG 22953 / PM1) TaxID=420662 RepID=A2SMW7_METPP|nr:hypothetical protein [Methylibium petroleiphilum]ABM96906.1 hypothetical protein Mpe_B0127 [Methylibium petroleiphilum PM1]